MAGFFNGDSPDARDFLEGFDGEQTRLCSFLRCLVLSAKDDEKGVLRVTFRHAYRHILCPEGKSLFGWRYRGRYHATGSIVINHRGRRRENANAHLDGLFPRANGLVVFVYGRECDLERAHFVFIACWTRVLLFEA